MTRMLRIEHAQSMAMVGRDITLWGAGRSLELAFRSTEFAFSVANQGIGKVIGRGKQVAADAREASMRMVTSGSTIAQENVLHDYEATIATTRGLLETSASQEVIKAAKETNGRAAKTLADFYIQHGLVVDLPMWRTLTNQVIEGGFDVAEVDRIHGGLVVQAPITDIIAAEKGLDHYVGSIDPTVPVGPMIIPEGIPTHQRQQL